MYVNFAVRNVHACTDRTMYPNSYIMFNHDLVLSTSTIVIRGLELCNGRLRNILTYEILRNLLFVAQIIILN